MALQYKVSPYELASIADAIRARASISEMLSFPGGMIDALGAINGYVEGTRTVYYNSEITNIRDYGFFSYEGLQEVNCPNVLTIGSSAFYQCHDLTSVNFPNASVIHANAFVFCYNLMSVDFPNV